MYFDRFDICEAYSLWAHDYGEYAVITRLNRLQFRPRPSLSLDTLSENSLAIYARLANVCMDPRHAAPCSLPCLGCMAECD